LETSELQSLKDQQQQKKIQMLEETIQKMSDNHQDKSQLLEGNFVMQQKVIIAMHSLCQ
jgi:hypothetical protein